MSVIRAAYKGVSRKLPDGKIITTTAVQELQNLGPVVPVLLSVPRTVATDLQAKGLPIPPPVQGMALVDTGASHCCIDRAVAQDQLKLQPNGLRDNGGVHGKSQSLTFAAALKVMVPNAPHPDIFLPSCIGAELSGVMPYIAILGRDFLANKVMVYDGETGQFTICW